MVLEPEHMVDEKITCTCQPIPKLGTEGGIGAALAYLETAMKAPVHYKHKE